jgi:hypothetical protein
VRHSSTEPKLGKTLSCRLKARQLAAATLGTPELIAKVDRSRAGRDIIVNVYNKVPAMLRPHVRDKDFLPLIEDRTRDFIGRSFIFQEIDGCVSAMPSGYILISGEPGIGKTALAAKLVLMKGWLHHFNMASAGIRSHEAFLGNICAQLIGRFGMEIQDLPAQAFEDSGFLIRLLDDAARRSLEPVVLVIDAVDEAAAPQPELGANRLLLPAVIPARAYVVITSRNANVSDLYAENIRSIHIADDDPRNVADLHAFAKRALENNPKVKEAWAASLGRASNKVIDYLVDRSEGNFQYLRLVLAEMGTSRSLTELPSGLQRYYRRHWDAMRSRSEVEYERLQRPVLCQLVAASAPVSIERLCEWTGLSAREVGRVLRDWQSYLNVTNERLYSIYHRSFAEFLEQEEHLEEFHSRIADVALAKAEHSLGRRVI